jgi:pyruvate/2-oxoglutarate dehydrogenase complex dihydrolipoamide acyltransferase (E2) component
MDNNVGPFRVVNLTPARRAWLNIMDLSRPSLHMYGLLEVDVTLPRQLIAEHKARTGETLSFTGFLSYCLARAVEQEIAVQAYPKGHRQIVMYDDVNVGLMIERKSGGEDALTGYVVRAANRKTLIEIHQEIRAAQQSEGLPPGRAARLFFSAMALPWPLCRVFVALFNLAARRDPALKVSTVGTVGVTAIGMFGKDHSGWGLEPTRHSLDLIVGSIATKPGVVAGRIEPREILHLTVVFDHDIVDGAPAARFTRQLVELIESGCGLEPTQS